MPAGVIGIVSGGASFAVAALAAGAAMHDDFVRARSPVFVDEEIRGCGGRGGGGDGTVREAVEEQVVRDGAACVAAQQEAGLDLVLTRLAALYRFT